TSFEALGAVRLHDYTLIGRGEPTLVIGGGVTANVFAIFRPKPLLGRALRPEDDRPVAPAVAVLSEPPWRERLGSEPNVPGQPVMLDNRPATIVGVLPAAFRTPPDNPPAALWAPLVQDPVFGDLRQKRGGHYLRIVGRLKPGVTLAAAQAELATIQ